MKNKVKNISDLKLAAILGTALFICTNIDTYRGGAGLFVWYAANFLSAISHIILALIYIKVFKYIWRKSI